MRQLHTVKLIPQSEIVGTMVTNVFRAAWMSLMQEEAQMSHEHDVLHSGLVMACTCSRTWHGAQLCSKRDSA